MTPVKLQTSDPFYFIDRAKDLFVETSLLCHGFTQSEKQEIEKTAWENLPKLGGMIAAIAGGILIKRNPLGFAGTILMPMLWGTLTGTGAQVALTGLLQGFGKKDFGDLLLASANDAFGASMSISVARGVSTGLAGLAAKTGWKFFLNSIFRGMVVGEAIGGAHALKNWDKTYGIEDVIISGMTGAVGGAWAPYVDKRWGLELLLEIPREFGENILQAKFDRFSDGDLTIQNVTTSFVLSFAELGGSIKGHTGGMEAKKDLSTSRLHDSPQHIKHWRSPAEVEGMWGLGDRGLLSREGERSGGHEGQEISWRVLAQARARRGRDSGPLPMHDAAAPPVAFARRVKTDPAGMQLISTYGEPFHHRNFDHAITTHRTHRDSGGAQNLAATLCSEIENGNAVDAFNMLHREMRGSQLGDYQFVTQVFIPMLEQRAQGMRQDRHFPDMFLRVIEVCENPEIHPFLRESALKAAQTLIGKNWDNLNTSRFSPEIMGRVVDCVVNLTRSPHPALWQQAAHILWSDEFLMTTAVARFGQNPLPIRIVIYMYTQLEAGMEAFSFSGMGADRVNHEMRCLVGIMDGYVARMEQAIETGDQDPHMSFQDLVYAFTWIHRDCFSSRVELVSSFFNEDTKGQIAELTKRHRALEGKMRNFAASRGGRLPRCPSWPAVEAASFTEMEPAVKTRVIQASVGRVREAQTGSARNPLAHVTIDAFVLNDLQRVLATRSQNISSRAEYEARKAIDADFQTQTPLTILNWIEDNRHYLNIFLYPHEFCYFVETHPEQFVRLRQWLRTLARLGDRPPLINTESVQAQVEAFLALTDLGLDFYRVMVGELPSVLQEDVRSPEMRFTRQALGAPAVVVERGRVAVARMGTSGHTELSGTCAELINSLTILVTHHDSIGIARAWMDVVEAHLESLWGFYHPSEGSQLVEGEKISSRQIQLIFRDLADRIDGYVARLMQCHFDGAREEVAHYQALAKKFRSVGKPPPPPRGSGGGPGHVVRIPVGNQGWGRPKDGSDGPAEAKGIPWALIAQARAQRDQGQAPLSDTAGPVILRVGDSRSAINDPLRAASDDTSSGGRVFDPGYFGSILESYIRARRGRDKGTAGDSLAIAIAGTLREGHGVEAFNQMQQAFGLAEVEYEDFTEASFPIHFEERVGVVLHQGANRSAVLGQLATVIGSPNYHPFLRYSAMRAAGMLLESYCDGVEEAGLDFLSNQLINFSRHSDPKVRRYVAEFIVGGRGETEEHPPQMRRVLAQFKQNPLPFPIIWEIVNGDSLDLMQFRLKPDYLQTLVAYGVCVVREIPDILAGGATVLGARQATNSLVAVYNYLQAIEKTDLDGIRIIQEACQNNSSPLNQLLGQTSSGLVLPEIANGSYDSLSENERLAFAHALHDLWYNGYWRYCAVQQRQPDTHLQIYNAYYVDRSVVEEVAGLLRERREPTRLEEEIFISYQDALALLQSTKDLRFILKEPGIISIFNEPFVFCRLVEEAPQLLATLRRSLQEVVDRGATPGVVDPRICIACLEFGQILDTSIVVYRAIRGEPTAYLLALTTEPPVPTYEAPPFNEGVFRRPFDVYVARPNVRDNQRELSNALCQAIFEGNGEAAFAVMQRDLPYDCLLEVFQTVGGALLPSIQVVAPSVRNTAQLVRGCRGLREVWGNPDYHPLLRQLALLSAYQVTDQNWTTLQQWDEQELTDTVDDLVDLTRNAPAPLWRIACQMMEMEQPLLGYALRSASVHPLPRRALVALGQVVPVAEGNIAHIARQRELDPTGPLGDESLCIDDLSMAQLKERLAKRNRFPASRLRRENSAYYRRILGEQSPFWMVEPLGRSDLSLPLNIFVEPYLFCELVENHPDILVNLRQNLRMFLAGLEGVKPSGTLVGLVHRARSLLVLTDVSLQVYCTEAGRELPPILARDVIDQPVEYVRVRLGPTPDWVNTTLRGLGFLSDEEEKTYFDRNGTLVALGQLPLRCVNKLGDLNMARAIMDVVELHTEGAYEFIRFNLEALRQQERLDEPDVPVILELFENIAQQLTTFALRVGSGAIELTAEQRHYASLAAKYRSLKTIVGGKGGSGGRGRSGRGEQGRGGRGGNQGPAEARSFLPDPRTTIHETPWALIAQARAQRDQGPAPLSDSVGPVILSVSDSRGTNHPPSPRLWRTSEPLRAAALDEALVRATPAVQHGLMSQDQVEYCLEWKRVVNPDSSDCSVVYPCMGPDISTVLYTTNATSVYGIDNFRFEAETLQWSLNLGPRLYTSAESRRLGRDEATSVISFEERLEGDIQRRCRYGYWYENVMVRIEVERLFTIELEKMGVDLSSVTVKQEGGWVVVEFDWAFPGEKPKRRKIYYTQEDAFRLLDTEILPGPVDIYFQKASNGFDIFPATVELLKRLVKKGGVFLMSPSNVINLEGADGREYVSREYVSRWRTLGSSLEVSHPSLTTKSAYGYQFFGFKNE